MSNRRILMVAIALGFVSGFSMVAVTSGAMTAGTTADAASSYTAGE